MNKLIALCFSVLRLQMTWCAPTDDEDTVEMIEMEPPVIIFAFSGLRWDVTAIQSMSSLERLKNEGAWSKRKINLFQSESLPSFVSMSSGQYPDKHGILSDKMKDLQTGELFDARTIDQKWWNAFEPIWITNQNKKNGSGSSALCYWPGHDVTFQGQTVKHLCNNASYEDPFKTFNIDQEITRKKVMPFKERVIQVQKWLRMNQTERPSFIGVYFEEPLNTMIRYGIHSDQTKTMLSEIDTLVDDMITRLKQDGVYENVHFIVTGESGATELHFKEHKEIFLDDKVDSDLEGKFDVIDDGAIMMIYPHDNATKQSLLSSWISEDGMTVYSKEDIPASFHFVHKQRTMPIVIVAEEHWRVYEKRVVDDKRCLMGYDGKYPSSHAFFVAKGPQIKKGYTLDAMGNVDVYGVLCKVLNLIPPKQHCGNETIINNMLTEKKDRQWITRVVTKIVRTITNTPRKIVLTVIVAVLLSFVVIFLFVTILYKVFNCCDSCPSVPRLVKVSPNARLIRKRRSAGSKGRGGHVLMSSAHHLLSDGELSHSDLSSSDEFYFDSVERRKK